MRDGGVDVRNESGIQRDLHPELALLAPVPFVFLDEGRDLCRKKGKVAFGSRAWELFRDLDALREGAPVEVFIYASQTGDPGAAVSWHAYYIGSVESDDGAHPDGRKYRPPYTMKDGEDRAAYWAVFWEVANLEPIAPIPTGKLQGWGAKKAYGKSFVPEGPIIIQRP